MHGVPPNLQPQTQDQVGSLGASAQGSDPQEIASQQQLRPQKAQVTLAAPQHTLCDLPHYSLSLPEASFYTRAGPQPHI